MNGEGMQKAVQGMTTDEKLVFLISEVGNLKTAVVAHAEVVSGAVTELNKMKVAQAGVPPYCNVRAGGFDKRIDVLEKDKAGREAVAKALWGVGGIGVVGIILTIAVNFL